MMASWAGSGAGPNNVQLHQEAGPSNSQLYQEAPVAAAAAGMCYICKRCLLLASFVRLKSDHPRGGCPGVGTAEELKLAEKGAKQLMVWGSNKNFGNKVYVSFLKSNKPEEFSKLEFSEGAEPDGNEVNVFCFCSKVMAYEQPLKGSQTLLAGPQQIGQPCKAGWRLHSCFHVLIYVLF
jgi:hypothetical protein